MRSVLRLMRMRSAFFTITLGHNGARLMKVPEESIRRDAVAAREK
jgi:hypothetical protein